MPGPLDRRWLFLAVAGGAALVAAVVAGVSVFESEPADTDTEQQRSDAPPREYGGPLWFTVGDADQTQLVTNSLPRGIEGPGTQTTGTARYLADQQCFTDGTHLLVWPRGSRPLSVDGKAGVAPADGLQIFDGEEFRANAEQLTILETPDFPRVDSACAPDGTALSLSAVDTP